MKLRMVVALFSLTGLGLCLIQPTEVIAAPLVPDVPAPMVQGPTVQGFVTKDGQCQWTSLDAATGEALWAWATPTTECPGRAFATKNAEGARVFSVTIGEGKALWLQGTPTGDLKPLPNIPHVEMARFESDRVHATTFGLKADAVIKKRVLKEGEEEFPPMSQEEIDNQWKHSCYTYALTDGSEAGAAGWKLVREDQVELHEGAGSPYCNYGRAEFASTTHEYFQYNFSFVVAPPTSGEQSWGLVEEMDVTKSGEPCGEPCKEDQILRRYAFGNYWFEGPRLSGSVGTWSDDQWSALDGLDGSLEEFFLAGDQLIVCTDQGFGAWNQAAGTRTWWVDSPSCPLRDRPPPPK
jgi:hypothetical protein